MADERYSGILRRMAYELFGNPQKQETRDFLARFRNG